MAAWVSYCACFACFLIPILGFFLVMLWQASKQGCAAERPPRRPAQPRGERRLTACLTPAPFLPGATPERSRYSYYQPRTLSYPQRWQQTNCTVIDSDVQLQWFNPLDSRAPAGARPGTPHSRFPAFRPAAPPR